MSKFLITTSKQKFIDSSKSIFCLGGWCFNNLSKSKLNGDEEVLSPLFPTLTERKKAFSQVNKYKESLLVDVSNILNSIHGLKKDIDFWNIFIGHWLQRYTEITFNRFYTIKKLENLNEEFESLSCRSSVDAMISDSSYDFIFRSNEDEWNFLFYNDILDFLNISNIKRSKIDFEISRKKKHELQENFIRKIKRFIRSFFSFSLSTLSRKNDIFIINSYLTKLEEFKLYLNLFQVPQLWRSPDCKQTSYNPQMRDKIIFSRDGKDDFQKFLQTQIKKVIPIIFLEGFENLLNQVEKCNWPISPSLIFTSNNFDTDEFFKLYAAIKKDEGSKYVTGQHGSNYGTHWYYGDNIWPERASSDRFVTWGFEENENTKKGFLFKIDNNKDYKKDGGVLLIEYPLPHRIEFFDGHELQRMYQEEQFQFYGCLNNEIKKMTTIRLHGMYKNMGWEEDVKWKEKFPDSYIEQGTQKMSELIRGSRLVVHSYDSTGLLETLAKNIPSVAFWQEGLENVLPSARKEYQRLVDEKIIFLTPESLAEHVNSIWANVDSWWCSEKTQDARKQFVNAFAVIEKKPGFKLSLLLKEEI